MSDGFEEELVEIWEASSKKLIDHTVFANRLEELLKDYGVTKESMILDTSGGFGFPAIDLVKRGYTIIFNDGSMPMFHRFFLNALREDAPAYVYVGATMGIGQVPWQEFHEFMGGTWDALVCKGNSLPYAASWGEENPDLGKSDDEVRNVLYQFHRLLVPGGVLYVDKQPEAQDTLEENLGVLRANDQNLEVVWNLYNDRENHVRNWIMHTRNVDTGERKTYHSEGYLLLEDQLVGMLREVGFKEVNKHVLEGDIYEGFVAVK